MFTCEISIIILICQKLGLVGPVQQKIKLPSPYNKFGSIETRHIVIMIRKISYTPHSSYYQQL